MTDRVGWVLVVPLKRLDQAKSRLGPPYEDRRRDLALAFALDTAAAALATPSVTGVLVVTDEPVAARMLTGLGAWIVADEPRAGLNPALGHGARLAAARHPGCGTGALSADLPALRPGELEVALVRAIGSGTQRCFVRDVSGTGTTLALARPGVTLEPQFGADSAAAHNRAGHGDVTGEDVPSVRLDVDTAADLEAARRLGVGPRTAAVLHEARAAAR